MITFTLGASLVPITVQLTVGNLAPFFAGVIAYMVVGERMTVFEISGMLLSFVGVILIAIAQGRRPLEVENTEFLLFGDDVRLAGIVGCSCMIVLSMANGVLSVLTRMMQSLHVSVMMVYIALISLIIMTVGLLIENWVAGGPLRIVHYTSEQYGYGFACGVLNVLALIFKIVAYQNERSGFVTLLGYIGLIYAFLGDTFIFNVSFGAMELIGVLIIFVLNMSLIFSKM